MTYFVSSGRVFSGLSLTNNSMVVCQGGSALATTLNNGGYLEVSSGATASRTTVNSGGAVRVEFGGIAVSTYVNSDGVMRVFPGGIAYGNSVKSWGSMYVGSGALAYINSIGTAGVVHLSGGGAANSTTVDYAGRLYVSSGATANNTTLNQGAYMYVYSGGVAANTTICGGTLNILSGGIFSGVTKVIGGPLYIIGAKVVNSGTILVSFRGDNSGEACLGNCGAISGGTIAVDGNDSDSGEFIFASEVAATSYAVKVLYNGAVTQVNLGAAVTLGELTYKVTLNSAKLHVAVYGKYTSVHGRVEGGVGDSVLTLSNCRVRSLVTGAARNVSGDVRLNLAFDNSASSPCNIYGGGNGFNVAGKVNLTVGSGHFTGMIYGGSRNGSVSSSTYISISGITHSDNPKLLKSGNSAWILGGGAAVSGGAATSRDVTVSIEAATLGQIVGGAQAQDAGSVAAAANVTISIQNCSISGDLFGGGYAYNGATSEVTGNVQIFLHADEENFLYAYGTIFGGGANPGHGSLGGWSLVRGDTTITLSGDGYFYNLVELNGDGRVGGTVYGTKTLEFNNFVNEFAANIKNFDVIKFSGETAMETGEIIRAETIAFDLDGRTRDDEVFASGVSFVLNQDKTFEIELGDAQGEFALLEIDESDVKNAVVNLHRYGELIGTFTYGDSYGNYTLTCSNGVLTLQA